MIDSVKSTHPATPLTLYANGSGGLLERLGATGADVVGLDWTVDMADARKRLGATAVQVGAAWSSCQRSSSSSSCEGVFLRWCLCRTLAIRARRVK